MNEQPVTVPWNNLWPVVFHLCPSAQESSTGVSLAEVQCGVQLSAVDQGSLLNTHQDFTEQGRGSSQKMEGYCAGENTLSSHLARCCSRTGTMLH